MDISGPFPVSDDGYRYILSVQCLFSKFVKAYPMVRQTAQEVADCIFSNLFLRFGFPAAILSDQGKQFDSDLFRGLCDFAAVHKMRTTAYRPTTNGTIERWHRTLNAMVAKVVLSIHKEITRKIDDYNYVVKKPGKQKAFVAHCDKLKPYNGGGRVDEIPNISDPLSVGNPSSTSSRTCLP